MESGACKLTRTALTRFRYSPRISTNFAKNFVRDRSICVLFTRIDTRRRYRIVITIDNCVDDLVSRGIKRALISIYDTTRKIDHLLICLRSAAIRQRYRAKAN